MLDQSPEAYYGTVELTQHTCYNQQQAAAIRMRDQGSGGKIVFIGSIMANFSAPNASAYTMSKCAIK